MGWIPLIHVQFLLGGFHTWEATERYGKAIYEWYPFTAMNIEKIRGNIKNTPNK